MNSEKRTAFLIVNPRAGRGSPASRAREIERFCERLRAGGVEVEVALTNAPRMAAGLAEEAARSGVREVIVRGGDGTINETIQGIVGKDVRLAIWPAGTANVLARHFRLPSAPDEAAQVFVSGNARRITLGRAVDVKGGSLRYFFMMAGVGLDASVVERVRPRLKRRIGEAAYWYSGFSHLASWHPRVFTVKVDGQSFPATYAAIGKAPWYGGGLAITPRARLDASEFEVCIIDTHSRLRYLYLLAQAMRGGAPAGARGVRFLHAARVEVEGDAGVQADGELIGQLPMTFEIVPELLEVVVP